MDRVLTSQLRKIEALWHWHPDCTVMKDGTVVKTDNALGNLAVVPVSSQSFKIDLIKGQEDPVQGWYSSEYNKVEASTTSSYSTEIDNDETLVWMLIPGEKTIPNLSVKIISETANGVQIKVTSPHKKWILDIPYQNSSKAKLTKLENP
ncbi:hypothetical protein [Flavivirga rizhaonensis]|uniref:Uncharacterized protein n=1 Tax=Flavivirga rizhaonensis TaxID=2559571 RepID=A0A4S1E1Q3_9FLAO|nr:hypothetical protein [Flavivirga rizhaonensis]TGV04611.1 hypothetical protein EM932_00350 [Flavivirga rizhaonensis]